MDTSLLNKFSDRRLRTSIVIIGLIVAFVLLCVRIVGVGDVGIVTRLGVINRQVNSGIMLKAPWPIERLTTMNIQIQKEQQDASAATKDLQTVTATMALNYNLTDDSASVVYKTIGVNFKDRIIDPVLQESVKSIASGYNADELISKRTEVETAIFKELSDKLGKRGITVDNVSIVNFAFSKAFSDAIEQKQVAQQNAQKAEYELQSANLQAQAQDVQAKTLTPEYLQLQAIQKWDGKMPSFVGGSGAVFNIPLTTNQ